MVEEIRIYIEGGGDGKNTKALIRQGFSNFLKELVQIARSKGIRWQIVACGSRNDAFRNFMNALEDHSNAFNVLLVDSEEPVNTSPWRHLKFRDNWDSLGTDDSHCYLMVQMMEAWFIADINTLNKFYGQEFSATSIPKPANVEKIDKDRLKSALKAATRKTLKGEYQKIQHASQLLERLDVSKVRKAAPHCDRLFTTLAQIMDASL